MNNDYGGPFEWLDDELIAHKKYAKEALK